MKNLAMLISIVFLANATNLAHAEGNDAIKECKKSFMTERDKCSADAKTMEKCHKDAKANAKACLMKAGVKKAKINKILRKI